MSPRSAELAAKARARLRAARHSFEAGDAEVAIGAAYYAMLYSARAALSERDLGAKTHSGVWNLLDLELEATGVVEPGLAAMGRDAQRLRERADYEAEDFDADDAQRVLADAEAFLRSVESVLE